MTDQPSPIENDRWWAPGLTPRPGGNPPEIPADYLYDPESNVYWSPQRPGFIPPRTTPPIIDRRVLPNGEVEEWERSRSTPDDFVYDPDDHAYYPPPWDIVTKTYVYPEESEDEAVEVTGGMPRPAEALDVSPAQRIRAGKQLDLFSGLDDLLPENNPPSSDDAGE